MKIKMLQSPLFATAFMAISLFGADKNLVPFPLPPVAPAPYSFSALDMRLLGGSKVDQENFQKNIKVAVVFDKDLPWIKEDVITSPVGTHPEIWEKIIPFDTHAFTIIPAGKELRDYGLHNKDIQDYYANSYFRLLREEFDRQSQ